MPGELTLADAVEQVNSNGVKDKNEGLANLRHILRSNTRFEALSNKAIQRLYESLFKVVVADVATYLKSKTATTRSATETRLSSAAGTLRLALEKTTHLVKFKTIRPVLDHITETLTLPDRRFCEPIALDYAKCLRSILNYQPHVEHLPKDQREVVVSFCVECVRTAQSDVEDDAVPGAEATSTAGTFNGLSYRSSRSTFKDSGGSQGSRTLAKQIAEEIVACLKLLTAAPNASSGKASADLLWALIEFLRKSTFAGRSHQDAFAAINNIIAWTRTEDIELTRRATSPLLRLIRTYWAPKLVWKDEMLTTLLYLEPYFVSSVQADEALTVRSELSGVLEVIRNEYSQRKERDQLQMEQVRFNPSAMASNKHSSIQTPLFALRSGNAKAEANWVILYMLALLCSLLSNTQDDNAPSDDDDDEIRNRPKKRQRLSDELDEMLKLSTKGSILTRTAALQTIAFLTQTRTLTFKQFEKLIDNISISCSEDNTAVSSWALLAFAGIASQSLSSDPCYVGRWSSAWQLAVRAMSNASTCRPACHLVHTMLRLKLVPQQSGTELVHTLSTAIDLIGPSALSDSVMHLLAYSVRLTQQTNPTSSSDTAEGILSWLFRTYSPSKFEDKSYAAQHEHFQPGDVVELITCCLGQVNSYPSKPQFPIWESVCRTWLACEEQRELMDYLLLLPDDPSPIHAEMFRSATSKTALQSRPNCERVVLNHFISELHRAQELWTEATQDRPRGITVDMFSFFCYSCCMATCVACCNTFRDSRRQKQLQRQMQDLLKLLGDFIASTECEQEKVDIMLKIFSTECSGLLDPSCATFSECEVLICKTIFGSIESRKTFREMNGIDEMDDGMELDDGFESQDSRRDSQAPKVQDLKSDSAVDFSAFSLRSSVSMYAAAIAKQENRRDGEEDPGSVSQSMVDYILDLDEPTILASRHVIAGLSNLGIDLAASDCYRLLDHCTGNILQAYPYERSEVATGAILDIASSLVSIWTHAANSSLYDLGIDMYSWYTTTALSGGVLSPSVQKRVAMLLLQLCHVDVDYGRDSDVDGLHSVRTSLFKLLQLGSITVQYHLANRISTIFGLFVLSNHAAMFDDLQSSLPDDTEWIEGMSMRLLFLAKLASAWHSLLRQCVYYIFETAGRVPNSGKHARRSIAGLTAALKFGSPQDLFALFAPQLLHTWLETHTLAALPFEAFQYDSLKALFENNRDEIAAQLLVRGDDAGMAVVTQSLGTNSRGLVVQSFAKCLAYSICWDIARSKATGGKNDCEIRLGNLIESNDHLKLLTKDRFATSMGYMYLALAQDDLEDSWLEGKDRYKSAWQALVEIKTFSCSDRELPQTQQPSFRSRKFLDEIERLCRRTSQDPAKPWNQSSFATAARMLLDSITSALGPLHTCQVIRKLRLLIAMAGDVALSGFPLEMLVRTLRPFLNDSQCADDVIGVLHYLLHRGQHSLGGNLPFLCGTITLMVLQIQKHSAGRQESTTQESQHQMTVQKMKTFQTFLIKFLQQCEPSDPKTKQKYSNLVTALSQVSLPGNARKDTPESALLLILLEESTSGHALLETSDRHEAILLLSHNFEAPSIGDDCLEDDGTCARYAHSLWEVIKVPLLSVSFVTWATTAIGRAYAHTGRRPLTSHAASRKGHSVDPKIPHGIVRSEAIITTKLCEYLVSRDRAMASVADHTLRRIALSFKGPEEAVAFEQILSSPIVPVLEGGTFGYEPRAAKAVAMELENARTLEQVLQPDQSTKVEGWVQSLAVILCRGTNDVPILADLDTALQYSDELALQVLPAIVHILLTKDLSKGYTLRDQLSAGFKTHLAEDEHSLQPKQRYLMQLLLFLRCQALPGESTNADRLRWLDVDWLLAAKCANRCQMPHTALLFTESMTQPSSGNRRASSRASLSQVPIEEVPQELLLSIFKAIEEPDSFYGVEQPASLGSVLDRLDYEGDGYHSLMFRSAQTDTDLRRSHRLTDLESTGMIRSLSMLNLNSLTFALLSGSLATASASDELLNSARRLQQWDIMPPETTSQIAASSFTALQEFSRATDRQQLKSKLRTVLVDHGKPMTAITREEKPSHDWFSTLASLAEADEMLGRHGLQALRLMSNRMQQRQSWMKMAQYDSFRGILSNRCAMFSILGQNNALSSTSGLSKKDCRIVEIESLLNLCRLAREHGQLQEAIGATTQIADLISECKDIGLKADAVTKFETSSVLWSAGEVTASVRMLRDALMEPDFEEQDIRAGRPGLLAQLAHQLSEARLEKPDEILATLLKPAITHLQKQSEGKEAGKVFYEFASFCDKQLQDPANIEELNRVQKQRQNKVDEVEELRRMSKTTKNSGTDKQDHAKALKRATQWYELDDADFQRLQKSKDTFTEQSLQNYLLALRASDEHDISVLRFFALWLENSEERAANEVVSKCLPQVPSWKFVVLMNQLMSRLEDDDSVFQRSLKSLATRICSEHPHHSVHHLFATTRLLSEKDTAAQSRLRVAQNIRKHVCAQPGIGNQVNNIFEANKLYNIVAFDSGNEQKGSRMSIRDLKSARDMAGKVPTLRVPPPTINLPLTRHGDYSGVPVVTNFTSDLRIMSGLSRPKRISAVASDGRRYVMLLKSGEDDLRQDAIMEQVFEESSKMLRSHKTARQRNLHVRTYKVIPLSHKSGIIEFVPNSTSFSDFLVRAHEQYYPSDMKYSVARNKISEVQGSSVDARVKTFRKICEQLQPVMRHFFFERFTDPDEWFEKRTAYTRTTAAVSILGHVLGLGDRHCQNIMLDERTGEVVHIDLGVAFEAGKVLPVPERVPFRLSRDVVDGMGITKTEGVFRRCCEFTLDALREDKDSIMTLLNVLRYDPLYTWTVSPLRAKRMQQELGRGAGDTGVPEGSSKKKEQEAGEADRALSTVEKKLSQTLSTAATVNELIREATDERRLATLFHGWSAFF